VTLIEVGRQHELGVDTLDAADGEAEHAPIVDCQYAVVIDIARNGLALVQHAIPIAVEGSALVELELVVHAVVVATWGGNPPLSPISPRGFTDAALSDAIRARR
jgi:hypothetical protein